MIAGLELPTSGRILLGGEDITFRRASEHDIAFVFQLFALYPHMSVRREHRLSADVPRGCRAPRSTAARVETARMLRIEALLDREVAGFPAATASAWRWGGRSSGGRRRS